VPVGSRALLSPLDFRVDAPACNLPCAPGVHSHHKEDSTWQAKKGNPEGQNYARSALALSASAAACDSASFTRTGPRIETRPQALQRAELPRASPRRREPLRNLQTCTTQSIRYLGQRTHQHRRAPRQTRADTAPRPIPLPDTLCRLRSIRPYLRPHNPPGRWRR
jgi:hypothetical protein